MKAFFAQDNSIQYLNDIKVAYNKQSKNYTVQLNCYLTVSEKKRKRFNDYFQCKIYHFIREMNPKLVGNIIALMTKKHPEELISIDFVSGFSPYGFY